MGNAHGTHFSKHYKAGKSIGSGTFATVKKCIRKHDSKEFAVKIIHKKQLTDKELSLLNDEISILTNIKSHNHPHIINIEDVFENDHKVKVVLELCQDKNLLQHIYDTPNRRLEESKSAKIIHTIAKAIQYLHDNYVVHRDLKPENILFTKNGTLKIADFGSAFHQKKASGNKNGAATRSDAGAATPKATNSTPPTPKWDMETNIGTPLYVAPEVLVAGKYSHMVDLWSLGVILYICLCGYHPFSSRKSVDKMYHNIINGKYSFSPSLWHSIDPDAIDLIKGLLCVDAKKRMTCKQILEHKWILKHVKDDKNKK